MQIHHVTPTELGGLREPLLDLYRRCFTEPPWNEPESLIEAYAGTLEEHLAQPGMSGLVATVDSAVAGVVYGWPAPAEVPDDPFHRALLPFVPADSVQLLVTPAVIVVELMVHPRHRGQGVGRALLNGFVTGHPSAWLCTDPEAPACALYESANWTALARYTSHRGDPRVLYTWTASAEQDIARDAGDQLSSLDTAR